MRQLSAILLISLIPIFFYYIIYILSFKKAKRLNLELPKFFNEKLLRALLTSISISIILFVLFIIFSMYNTQSGQYVPATVVNGKIIQGHVIKK